MNYMKQVAEILGVGFGEEFKVKGCGDELYTITEDGLYNDEKMSYNLLLFDILKGDLQIITHPWKPKEGESGYYISPNGELFRMGDINFCYARDLLFVYHGLIYRTEEEALAHKDETMRKWDEMKKEIEER